MNRRLYTITCCLTVFLGAVWFFLPSSVSADTAEPDIEIVGPTPNAILYQDTAVTYEVYLRSGSLPPPNHRFRIEWEPLWDGDLNDPFTPDPAQPLQEFEATSYPVSGVTEPALRYTKLLAGETQGQKFFRVRVTDCGDDPACDTGDEVSLIKSHRFYLINNVAFSGWTWSGASSPRCEDNGAPCSTDADCNIGVKCGNDALGWTSFSCANQNLICQAPGGQGYGVRIGTAQSGSQNATLYDNAWIGDPSGGAYSIGWMSFNRKYCSSETRSGLYCINAGDPTYGCPDDLTIPGTPTCDALGTPPANPPPELEAWGGLPDASRVYTAVTKFCVGGTNPGTVCTDDTSCTGGGTCSAARYPGQVAGWSRLLGIRDYGKSLNGSNEWGWVHLRGTEAPTPYTQAGNAYRLCSDCSVGGTKCNICNQVNQAVGDPKPYSCNSCYDTDTPSDGIMNVCERCDEYGVSYDSRKGKLLGYGWGGKEEESGIGWVQFNPTLYGGIGILQAWLATRYGDIFVGGNIEKTGALPSSPEGFNATYVIQANGTIAFTSEAGYIQPNYPSALPLPTQGNQYINVLGRLDFNTMTQVGTHRYGETISVNAVTNDLDDYLSNTLLGKLGGKIYYYQGDAEIDSAVTFKPDSAATANGSGTIIVDGDLTISAPVLYDTNLSIGSLANLPSVAWLVRGNVNIDPGLGNAQGTAANPNLVGAFIVVGYEGGSGNAVGCSGKPPDDPSIVGGGILSTGAATDKYLVVNGLMMAKCFNFERTIQIADVGSEHVVYDGRLIANPPPGLRDLTAVLPVIREVTPE